MKKVSLTILAAITVLSAICQKRASELTVVYDYSIGSEKGATGSVGGNTTHTIYIKGNKCRSEMTNSEFNSTIIYDGNTGFAVILKEVSGQKLLIRLNPDNWHEKNSPYDGLVYKPTGETKEIAGYKCVKATATTRSGTTITVYYTKEILPDNKDYDPAFRSLDGLPLEYTLTNGNQQINYRVNKINFSPVPAGKFDIPASGYREMNYADSKKQIGG